MLASAAIVNSARASLLMASGSRADIAGFYDVCRRRGGIMRQLVLEFQATGRLRSEAHRHRGARRGASLSFPLGLGRSASSRVPFSLLRGAREPVHDSLVAEGFCSVSQPDHERGEGQNANNWGDGHFIVLLI